MYSYTGHPYVDIGIATLQAFAGANDPQMLTAKDIEIVIDYIGREYTRPPLRGFLHGAVFMNSGFTQPAYFSRPDLQNEYSQKVLNSFSTDIPHLNEDCVFTGEKASGVAFDVKGNLPLGRAYRQHIPLITAENVINFHPYGESGLPISGKAMLAIQVFPLGCGMIGGRLLAVHSDNHELMLHFARTFLNENRGFVQLAQMNDNTKTQKSSRKPKTRLIEVLLEADWRRSDAQNDAQPFNITAYHLNNGKDPKLDIYHLPMQIIAFLRDMEIATFHAEWHAIVQKAWDRPANAKEEQNFQPSRNRIYEDLFDLENYNSVVRFIRTYFLRTATRTAYDKNDPRIGYSLQQEIDLISWKITERFLRRIMNVDKARINAIRELGDRLAAYVHEENDKRFFNEFYRQSSYDRLRLALIKANSATLHRGQEPFLTLDSYVSVFEEETELARPDWRLARDLVLIRMIEQLYRLGHQEIVAEVATDIESTE